MLFIFNFKAISVKIKESTIIFLKIIPLLMFVYMIYSNNLLFILGVFHPKFSSKLIFFPDINITYSFPEKRKSFHVYSPNLYNGESQMLAIKLAAMNEYVDYFIISISNISHSRQTISQPTFSPMEEEIAKYAYKITYFEQNYTLKRFSNAWHVLIHQKTIID